MEEKYKIKKRGKIAIIFLVIGLILATISSYLLIQSTKILPLQEIGEYSINYGNAGRIVFEWKDKKIIFDGGKIILPTKDDPIYNLTMNKSEFNWVNQTIATIDKPKYEGGIIFLVLGFLLQLVGVLLQGIEFFSSKKEVIPNSLGVGGRGI